MKADISPSLDFRLFPKQALVFSSEADEILFGGAAGGGKSYLLRVAGIIWCTQIPGIQVYLFRRQFVDLEANHLNGPASIPALLSDWLKKEWVTWNRTNYQFRFWNGSSIQLAHCKNESDRWNYSGFEMHVLLVDELASFTPIIYKFLRSRVRMTGIKIPPGVRGKFPRIVCASNPGGACHNYMRLGWVKAAPPMTLFRAPEEDGGMMRQFIPAKIEDNPALVESDPQYIARLKGLGDPILVKAYMEGSFDIIQGGMFDDVWDEATHVIEPFVIPPTWRVDRAFDWGSARPFAVLWFAESDGSDVIFSNGQRRSFPRGTLFVIGEWYGWNGNEDEGCRMIAADIAKGIIHREKKVPFKVHPGPADNNIFSAGESGTAIADDMSKEGVEWIESDKRPGSRRAGWERIRGMLLASRKRPMEDPGLFVFNNCLQLRRTVPHLQRSDTDAEDIKPRSEDHIGDVLRYRVLCGNLQAGTVRIGAF